MISRVTSKGQVSIPKAVRDRLNIHFGDELECRIESGQVILKPLHASADVSRLKGMLTAGRRVSESEIRKARKSALSRKWASQ